MEGTQKTQDVNEKACQRMVSSSACLEYRTRREKLSPERLTEGKL